MSKTHSGTRGIGTCRPTLRMLRTLRPGHGWRDGRAAHLRHRARSDHARARGPVPGEHASPMPRMPDAPCRVRNGLLLRQLAVHADSVVNGRLLTADDLAERWRVPKTHVYRLAREGRIPVVKLGR